LDCPSLIFFCKAFALLVYGEGDKRVTEARDKMHIFQNLNNVNFNRPEYIDNTSNQGKEVKGNDAWF